MRQQARCPLPYLIICWLNSILDIADAPLASQMRSTESKLVIFAEQDQA